MDKVKILSDETAGMDMDKNVIFSPGGSENWCSRAVNQYGGALKG